MPLMPPQGIAHRSGWVGVPGITSGLLARTQPGLTSHVPEIGFHDDGDENPESKRLFVGKRLFVLSLQGETLQVWRPRASDHWLYGMCMMGNKLILRVGKPSNAVENVALWAL